MRRGESVEVVKWAGGAGVHAVFSDAGWSQEDCARAHGARRFVESHGSVGGLRAARESCRTQSLIGLAPATSATSAKLATSATSATSEISETSATSATSAASATSATSTDAHPRGTVQRRGAAACLLPHRAMCRRGVRFKTVASSSWPPPPDDASAPRRQNVTDLAMSLLECVQSAGSAILCTGCGGWSG